MNGGMETSNHPSGIGRISNWLERERERERDRFREPDRQAGIRIILPRISCVGTFEGI